MTPDQRQQRLGGGQAKGGGGQGCAALAYLAWVQDVHHLGDAVGQCWVDRVRPAEDSLGMNPVDGGLE